MFVADCFKLSLPENYNHFLDVLSYGSTSDDNLKRRGTNFTDQGRYGRYLLPACLVIQYYAFMYSQLGMHVLVDLFSSCWYS